MNKRITLNKKKCTACGDCAAVCPRNILEIREISSAVKQSMTFFQKMDALYHKNKTLTVISPEKCLGCGECLTACRHHAIFLERPKGDAASATAGTRTPDTDAPRPQSLPGHPGTGIKRTVTNFPPFYFFGAVLLNIAAFLFAPRFNLLPMPYILLGIPVLAGGFHLINKSTDLFNQNKTTFYLEAPSAFVQDGFYRTSRNPMYLGMLIFITGLAVLLGNLTGLIAPLLFFLAVNGCCIPPEEAIMEQTFGKAYFEYTQRVRRWI